MHFAYFLYSNEEFSIVCIHFLYMAIRKMHRNLLSLSQFKNFILYLNEVLLWEHLTHTPHQEHLFTPDLILDQLSISFIQFPFLFIFYVFHFALPVHSIFHLNFGFFFLNKIFIFMFVVFFLAWLSSSNRNEKVFISLSTMSGISKLENLIFFKLVVNDQCL